MVMVLIMTRMMMMIMTRNLKMTRCQYWVESPMSRQAKEKVRVPPASINVLMIVMTMTR